MPSCPDCEPLTRCVTRGEGMEEFARITAFGGSGAAAPDAKDGNLVREADVTSISVESWAGTTQVGATTALSVATVIYDTAETTGIWTRLGSGGGNAHFIIPASLFDTDSPSVTVSVTITMTDGAVHVQLYDVTVIQPPG